MLLVIQFPMADVRPFRGDVDSPLSSPYWEHPDVGKEFVRGFGPIDRRRRGDLTLGGWEDEVFYCRGKRGLRFCQLEKQRVGPPAAMRKHWCAFRRLFRARTVVVRFAVGLSLKPWRALDGKEVLSVARDFLDLPTQVVHFRGERIQRPLQRQAAELAKLFLYATTPTACMHHRTLDQCSVSPGEVLLLVEYEEDEIASLPHRTSMIDIGSNGSRSLAYSRLRNYGRDVGIWFLNGGSSDRNEVRRLRACLFRIHAEQQVLARVLRLISQGWMRYEARTDHGDFLEQYLNDITRSLFQRNSEGFVRDSIRKAMYAQEALVSHDERQMLLRQLKGARRQILKKVEAVTETQVVSNPHVLVVGNNNKVYEGDVIEQGGKEVTNTTINFGSNNTFHGDVVAASNIESKPFSKVRASSTGWACMPTEGLGRTRRVSTFTWVP